MNYSDRILGLINEEADLGKKVTRTSPNPSPASPTLVVRTKTLSSYPRNPGSFFACEHMSVFGNEIEGMSGSLTSCGSTLFALNLGSAVPASGTVLLVAFVENRWVFRHDG